MRRWPLTFLASLACSGDPQPVNAPPVAPDAPAVGPDADHDGLPDDEERRLGTDPNVPDSDGDGKKDGDEVQKHHTNPLSRDSDNDGVWDGAEIKTGTDPNVADAPSATAGQPGEGAQPQTDASGSGLSGPGPQLPTTGEAPPASWQCDAPNVHWVTSISCFDKVAGASFRMGAQAKDASGPGYDPEAQPDESPVREVTVSPFWLQRSEVSAALYQTCLDAGGCNADEVLREGQLANLSSPDRQKHPVNGVSWAGAQRLCGWLGGRLPTEAEWELATRGTQGRRYQWGDNPTCGYAVDRVGREGENEVVTCTASGTHEVQDQPLGGKGPFFLSGNVWEWTLDWYAPYDPAQLTDPRGPVTGTTRTQRGGGWLSDSPRDLRGAGRAAAPPDQKLPDVGFRCAWTGRPQ